GGTAIVMKAGPIGAFGAMAFTIGRFGTGAILNLLGLIATFYMTAALFVFVVLGIIARLVGFSIFKFLAYIKDELLIVLGTSSSESALPSLMEKLERLGCSKSVVGLVVPTGYSFNLDGTNIYMTLATLFIAQALGFDLTLGQQITILLVAMLTSKGASGITGAGFITLAATLAVVGFGSRQRTRKVDADTVAKFSALPVANISDSMSRMTAGGAALRPMHAGGVLAGPAFTVKTRPGDNLMLHKAIDIAEPGDVI